MGGAEALWASPIRNSACSFQVTLHSKPGRLDLQGESSRGIVCWHFGPPRLRVSGPLAPGLICVSSQRLQFGMYALYSKNKPRSDALMTSFGHVFFKVDEPETRGGGDGGSKYLEAT